MTNRLLLGTVCAAGLLASALTAACTATEESAPGENATVEAAPATSTTSEPAPVPAPPHAPGDSPVPPGAALDISSLEPVPGEYFDYSLCTAAWSFVLDSGRTIAVTAAHCGEPGDTVWAGNAEGEFTYPAEPVGTVVYSDLSAPDTHGLDFALVEITRPAEFYTPREMGTQIATGEGRLPDSVCKLGRVTAETCGPLTHAEGRGTLTIGERSVDTVSARAQVCSRQGDSGAPVYGAPGTPEDGRIVGVLSGTTGEADETDAADAAGGAAPDCAEAPAQDMSFTVAADIEAVLPEILAGL